MQAYCIIWKVFIRDSKRAGRVIINSEYLGFAYFKSLSQQSPKESAKNIKVAENSQL
jgi:hypothetical protein